MQNRILFALASLGIVALLAWTVFSQTRKSEQKIVWEYKTFITGVTDDRQINEHASAGWKLVTATALCANDHCNVAVYMKKRK